MKITNTINRIANKILNSKIFKIFKILTLISILIFCLLNTFSWLNIIILIIILFDILSDWDILKMEVEIEVKKIK